MNRRSFLATACASTALAALPVRAPAQTGARAGALPMPPTRDDGAPERFVDDPNRWLLDAGWLFHAGDIPMPTIVGHGWTYANAKAGNAQGAAAVDYDDGDWAEVTLPHDWAILGPVVEDANVSQGYRKRGYGWYRRTLRLDPEDRGKALELQFGAIATHATIWFNGTVVAHNWSGYNSIYVDISSMARFGDDLNTIAIRVDADKMEGWWYEGAGLYRHAWLVKRPPVHIVTDGLHADPREGGSGWTVPVVATCANIGDAAATVTLEAVLNDPGGREVVRGEVRGTMAELGRTDLSTELGVPSPELWSVDAPALYTLVTRLVQDGRTLDERRVRLGFRTLRFDAASGFHFNGVATKIKGVCLHQDHAGVGVAVPDALWVWRLERLKEMGVNAIRFSHNAIATEVLDACDRMGFLVMSENRNFNVSPDYLEQLEWLVRRDRNRPSVFMWSVFNEEPMQGTPQGYEMVRRMAALVKTLDTSRPVTAAMNSGMFAPVNVSQAVDVVGFNYQQNQYDRFHATFPTLPLTSSEDTSAFQTRGAWENDEERQVKSSYDDNAADWGATHTDGWERVASRPFIAGGFVWTGFDYHGEPTPYTWPSNSSYFGIMDLCGFPKAAFYQHRAQWDEARPHLDLSPHWTWPERDGQPIRVVVNSNVERVVLRLNDRPAGEVRIDPLAPPSITVPYAPGRLEAIGYRDDREVVRTAVETVGAPVALRVTPARSRMAGDGEDVQPFTIDAVDARGRHVPTADLPVTFTVSGGTIVGIGNGNPTSLEPSQGNARRLFNGLAQVIVRADPGGGTLTLGARAERLRAGSARVRRVAARPRPAIGATRPVSMLGSWRLSPASATRPDPAVELADNDMNSWLWVRPGEPQAPSGDGRWAVLRARFTPHRRVAEGGGRLILREVTGRAEVWIDGRQAATKRTPTPGTIEVRLAPGAGERTVTLLIEGDGNATPGLTGQAFVTE